ncbi:MAG: hypothetical protein WC314_22750 [Vulcanimicrobiota bacterium]
MEDQKKKLIKKIKSRKQRDEVTVAGESSFPASDPPAYWASAPKEKPSETRDPEPSDS